MRRLRSRNIGLSLPTVCSRAGSEMTRPARLRAEGEIVAPQLHADHLLQVGGVLPQIADIKHQAPLHEAPEDGGVELLGLVCGGDEEAVASAEGDLVEDDVRRVDQGGLLLP